MPLFQDQPDRGGPVFDPTAAGARLTELPVTLPMDAVLLRTNRAVVHLTGALVYTTGLAFQVTAVLADGGPPPAAPTGPPVGLMGRQGRQPMLGVEFSDGRSAHNYGRPGGRAGRRAGEVRLSAGGADYYGRRATLRCFLSPLPPPGDLTFAVAWPARGLTEHTTTVAVGDLAAAAQRVATVAFNPDTRRTGGSAHAGHDADRGLVRPAPRPHRRTPLTTTSWPAGRTRSPRGPRQE